MSRKLTEGVAEAYQYTAEDERGNASDYLKPCNPKPSGSSIF